MTRMQQILVFVIALIWSSAIPTLGYSSDRRRISHNSRQLQLVLDTPLDTESEELSYASSEEANKNEKPDNETLSVESEEESTTAAADSTEHEDSTGEVIDHSIEEDSSPPVGAPVKADRHPRTSAPTESGADETFDSSPAPTRSIVTETIAPTHAPTKQNAVETSPPSPAPTISSVIETAPPTLAPTKSLVVETPRPSPAPIHTPTQSPVKENHPTHRTARPTLGRDAPEPDNYDLWDNKLDETFSQHATSSPATSSKASTPKSESKNHALEKEAEEFVEDPYVRIATLVFAVVCVTLLILVAQQMVENPDGLCAKLCRWTVAFFRMLCYPFVFCLSCGGRNKAHHTHTLVSTDGFDDYDHDLSLA